MPAGVIGPRGRITTVLVPTYQLSDADNRNTLVFDYASTITVTIPQGLQIGWTADIVVQGAGNVVFSAQTGVTLNNLNSSTGVAGQFATGQLKSVNTNIFDLFITTASTPVSIPTADLLGGDGTAFTSVTVGDGLDLTTGTLSNPIPTADIIGGDGTDYTSISVSTGLDLTAGVLTATGGSGITGTLTGGVVPIASGATTVIDSTISINGSLSVVLDDGVIEAGASSLNLTLQGGPDASGSGNATLVGGADAGGGAGSGNVLGGTSITTAVPAGDAVVKGGSATVGDAKGGDAVLRGGVGHGSGKAGQIVIGDAVAIANLPAAPTFGFALVNDALAPAPGVVVGAGGAASAVVCWGGTQWTVIGI